MESFIGGTRSCAPPIRVDYEGVSLNLPRDYRDMTKSEIKFMRFVALERFPMDLQFHVVRSVAWEFIQIESNQNIPEIIADIAVVVVA